eukprot:5240679-Ditylum_brightwellii.AAC.1
MGGGGSNRIADKDGKQKGARYSWHPSVLCAGSWPNLSSCKQATVTRQTKKACHQLLNCVAMHLNAAVQFMASDVILAVHSDASYLSETKARNRAAGHFYLANNIDEEYNNGAILTLSTIIRYAVASASDAELVVLFYNGYEAVPLFVTLEEMGHPNHQHPSSQTTIPPMDLPLGP